MDKLNNTRDRLLIKAVAVIVILFTASACTPSTTSHQEKSIAGVGILNHRTRFHEVKPVGSDLSVSDAQFAAAATKRVSLSRTKLGTTRSNMTGLLSGTIIKSKTLDIGSLFADRAPVSHILEYLTSASYQRMRTQSDYRCDNSGSALFTTIGPFTDSPEEFRYLFTDCQLGSQHYHGSLVIRQTTPTTYSEGGDLIIKSDWDEFYQSNEIRG